MKKKSFIIACGGTGGHLSPGIALAERLTEKGFHCTLLVSKKKIDTRLAGKYASLEFMQAPGCAFSLSPKGFFKFLFLMRLLLWGFPQSARLLYQTLGQMSSIIFNIFYVFT